MDDSIVVPKMVVVESPFRGDSHKDTLVNVLYARLCVHDSLVHGEVPFASHLLYIQTGITDDKIDREREMGMRAGWVIGNCASLSAFYVDRGWSSGMKKGMDVAMEAGRPTEERSLGSPEEVASMIEELARTTSSVNCGIIF